MSNRAKHQALAFLLIITVVFSGVFIGLGLIPIHFSGVQQVIINVGGQEVGIGTSETSGVVHYKDGSTETLSGETLYLNPTFAKLASVGSQKEPDTIDVQNEVIYKKAINLQDFCVTRDFLLWKTEECPVDALLVITTDIYITVDGVKITGVPSNGRYEAYSTNGALQQFTQDAQEFWSTFGVTISDVNLFQAGVLSYPWKKSIQLDPYRQQDKTVTLQLIGTQKFEMYPVFRLPNSLQPVTKYGSMICPAGEQAPCGPVVLQISHPTYDLPPLSVTTPDFLLDMVPTQVLLSTSPVNDGNKGFTTISAGAYNAYTGAVHFGVRNLPSGVTYSFERNDEAFTTTSQIIDTILQLEASTNAKVGEYTPTVTATGTGLAEKTIELMLTITSEPQPCPGGAYCPGSPTVLTASAPSSVVMLFQYTISGKLTSPTGVGILGAKITATTSWGGSGTANTDQNGAYTISISAPTQEGIYDATVGFAGDSTYSASNSVQLAVSVRAIPSTWILIIAIIIIVVIALAIVGVAMSRRKPGGP